MQRTGFMTNRSMVRGRSRKKTITNFAMFIYQQMQKKLAARIHTCNIDKGFTLIMRFELFELGAQTSFTQGPSSPGPLHPRTPSTLGFIFKPSLQPTCSASFRDKWFNLRNPWFNSLSQRSDSNCCWEWIYIITLLALKQCLCNILDFMMVDLMALF